MNNLALSAAALVVLSSAALMTAQAALSAPTLYQRQSVQVRTDITPADAYKECQPLLGNGEHDGINRRHALDACLQATQEGHPWR